MNYRESCSGLPEILVCTTFIICAAVFQITVLWSASTRFLSLNKISKRITLRDSLQCWRLSLWDEEKGEMVSFSEVRERR